MHFEFSWDGALDHVARPMYTVYHKIGGRIMDTDERFIHLTSINPHESQSQHQDALTSPPVSQFELENE
jgi:hypothetical protein